MRTYSVSRGMTLIGFLLILGVASFFAYMAMRLIPMYTEYMGVVKAMQQVALEPGIVQKSIEEIRGKLSIKFDSQYVSETDVPPQSIQLLRESNGVATLNIHYEKRVPFAYNVQLVATFDKSVILGGSSD